MSDNSLTLYNRKPLAAWYLVLVLMLVYTVSFIDRQIITLLVEPIQTDLNISDTQISLLQGFAFAVFYSFLGIPIAHIADHANRRNLIITGLAIWSLMTIACGFAVSFWLLFWARVGVGVGEAALSPAAHSIISDTFPKERLSKTMSIYGIGIVAGSGLAYILGGLVIHYAAESSVTHLPLLKDIQAWQLVFIVVGALSLPFILLLGTIREPARHTASHANNEQITETFSVFLRRHGKLIVLYLAGFSLMALAAYSYFAWGPTVLIREYGWTASRTGLWFGAIVLIFGTLGAICGGSLSDYLLKKGHADAPVITGLITAVGIAATSVVAVFAESLPIRLMQISATLFFLMFPIGIIPAGLHLISPNYLRARMSALSLFFANIIGLGIGPTCVALLADYAGFTAAKISLALNFTAGIASIVAFLLLFACRNRYRIRYGQIHQI